MLGIDKIGCYNNEKNQDVIHRFHVPPAAPPPFPYLVAVDKLDSIQTADLVTIPNFQRAKNTLKKTRKHGLGVEFLLSPARKMSGQAVAKWFGELLEAYAFCEDSGCQFIVSSGAGNPSEMISGRSFDAILTEVGVDPQTYWCGLEKWLCDVAGQKVIVK
jgi:hypothetical protein